MLVEVVGAVMTTDNGLDIRERHWPRPEPVDEAPGPDPEVDLEAQRQGVAGAREALRLAAEAAKARR